MSENLRTRPRWQAGAAILVVVAVLAAVVVLVNQPVVEQSATVTVPSPSTTGAPVPRAERSAGLRDAGGAGRVALSLPETWVSFPVDKSSFDAKLSELRADGRGVAADVAQRLAPGLFPAVATVAVGGAQQRSAQEVRMLVVGPAGEGYVLLTTVPSRGSSLLDVRSRVVDDLSATGRLTADQLTIVGSRPGVRLAQVPNGSAEGAEVVVEHLVAVVGSNVVLLTSTGAAPTDLAATTRFDEVPAVPEASARTVTLAPTFATTLVYTPGASWLDLPVVPAEFANAVAEMRRTADPGLLGLLDQLASGPLRNPNESGSDPTGSAPAGSIVPTTAPPATTLPGGPDAAGGSAATLAPVAVSVEPNGRGYLLVNAVVVGGIELDEVIGALASNSDGLTFSKVDVAIGSLAGARAERQSPDGTPSTIAIALVGPILVQVVAIGAGTGGVLSSMEIRDVAPIPQDLAPGGRFVRIPVGSDGQTFLTFPFIDGWREAPTDQKGFRAFVEQARANGQTSAVTALETAGELLLLDLGDLPFNIDLSGLPRPQWVGLGPDGTVFAVMILPSDGRSLAKVVADVEANSREGGGGPVTTALSFGDTPVYEVRSTSGATAGIAQYLAVVGDQLLTTVQIGTLPQEIVANLRVVTSG